MTEYESLKFYPSGDCAVVMEFENTINPVINRRIREVIYVLEKESIQGIVECIPTYRSILFVYDPTIISYYQLIARIKDADEKRKESILPLPMVTEIPTIYGGEYGPDLEHVAKHAKLSVDEVIEIHSSTNYLIFMLGFTPGFPYLGGMSNRIATPRLKVPRERIVGGSVGIADNQTGIYPIDSPGGWQLIGRTPLKLFEQKRQEPVLLKAGNYLRFVPISIDEYRKIEEEVKQDIYIANTYPLEIGGEQNRN